MLKKVVSMGLVVIMILLTACSSNSNSNEPTTDFSNSVDDVKTTIENDDSENIILPNLDLVNSPTESYIISCLSLIDDITGVQAVTSNNDPNGGLNKSGSYYSAVYFSVKYINQKTVYGDDLVEKGTDAGGCIEAYKTVDDAEVRDAYLSAFDDSKYLTAGYHTVVGTLVIRTSQFLTEEEQEQLEKQIISVLTDSNNTIEENTKKESTTKVSTTKETTIDKIIKNDKTTVLNTENTTGTIETTVSYSTNTRSTVKNGNSGVYSYKSDDDVYDRYWIIDFDSGYVYSFSEGNGDEHYDRVKISSGNLNSFVTIIYHADDMKWSYRLYFKYKNQPEILIVQDNDGFEYEFYATNLKSALELKNNKSIVNY